MRTKLLVLVVTMLWAYSPRGHAQESKPLGLQDCIDIALEKNPLLLSSAEYYRASLARIKQATALPQPVFGYASDLQPSFFDFKNALESYTGLGFAFDFPTKISDRGKIARKESDAFLSETQMLRLEIIFAVNDAFYGLLLAQEKLGYAEDNLELARDFAEKTELKFEAGEVARVEALRARVEAAGAETEVRTARNDVRLARALLNFHLARRESEPIMVEGDLKAPPIQLDLEGLTKTAFEYRPELEAVQLLLEREEIARGLAKQSYLPDFEIGISKHKFEGEPSTWEITFAFPLPLYFWQPKQGEIAEAQANIRALQREVQHIENTISLEVEQAYRDAMTAVNQIELFEQDILTQAEEVYNMFLFSYQEGEIGGIELIAARRTLMEARKAYADALYAYSVALAAVQKAIGQGVGGNDDD
jgi:cobalt-zinc-cadmium efflux system outer membrane protein